jgi:hypothetical protein
MNRSHYRWSGCALCPDESGEIADWVGGIPLCSGHAQSVVLTRSKATEEAQGIVTAREWRARQTYLFDDLAYRTYGARRGWWAA